MANEHRNDSTAGSHSGSGNFHDNPDKAREAGKKGGQASHQGKTGSSDNQPSREAAHKDSQHSHEGSGTESHQDAPRDAKRHDETQAGSGHFADNRQKATDAERKGGQSSHGKH